MQVAGSHLLVIMPTWLGDGVMATPTLAALRSLEPRRITALMPAALTPLFEHHPAIDHCLGYPGGVRTGLRLRAHHFDLGVLLPNSFRSALLLRLTGAARRVGYDRDGRGWLLTHRLHAPRSHGSYTPVPAVDYYLQLAAHLGAKIDQPRLTLGIGPMDTQRARTVLPDGPLVVISPGSAKPEKRWPAAQFAQLADALADRATVALTGSPAERAVLDEVHRHARRKLLDLPSQGVGLAALKAVLARAKLTLTNDSGTRHIAAAMGCPVVTLYTATDPAWTRIPFEHDIALTGDLSLPRVLAAAEPYL